MWLNVKWYGGQSQLLREDGAYGSVAVNLKGQPLVFTVLAGDTRDYGDARPDFLVRGVQGIDPTARGLVVSDEAREGSYMTFGVRDGRESVCPPLQTCHPRGGQRSVEPPPQHRI